jgi:hypothetical protein
VLDQYRSGTRIKMRMLTTPDGAKVFQSAWDSARNEDCSFQQAADGVTRCLPSAQFAGFFADPACTVLAALINACSQPPKYLLTIDPAPTCAMGPRIYSVAPGPLSSVYARSGTSCITIAISPGFAAYGAAGLEISPTAFQSATSSVE